MHTRYSSLKSVHGVHQSSATSLNAVYTLNPNMHDILSIADYCFRLGSEMIPPSRIRGTASVGIRLHVLFRTIGV